MNMSTTHYIIQTSAKNPVLELFSYVKPRTIIFPNSKLRCEPNKIVLIDIISSMIQRTVQYRCKQTIPYRTNIKLVMVQRAYQELVCQINPLYQAYRHYTKIVPPRGPIPRRQTLISKDSKANK